MSASTRTKPASARTSRPRTSKRPHYGTHIFLTVMAVMWMIPLGWALFTALRPKADTDKYGYFSLGVLSILITSPKRGPRVASRNIL